MTWTAVRIPVLLPVVVSTLVLAACEQEAEAVPTASEVESYYTYRGELEASMQGATAQIRATQPREQLERGGRLWARVGPYILLFSDETRTLFRDYPGLEAVRVVTTTPEGDEIARAYLPRNAMTGLMWPEALNIAARARTEGTDRPTLLEELVRYGETRTDFEYAEEYQRRP